MGEVRAGNALALTWQIAAPGLVAAGKLVRPTSPMRNKENPNVTSSTVPAAHSAPALPQDSRSCFIDPLGDDLIRRDLHGPDHLEALARELASASVLAPPGQRGRPLLRHFARM